MLLTKAWLKHNSYAKFQIAILIGNGSCLAWWKISMNDYEKILNKNNIEIAETENYPGAEEYAKKFVRCSIFQETPITYTNHTAEYPSKKISSLQSSD